MVGVRVMDYRSSTDGIDRDVDFKPAKEKILLVERNDETPDRIPREEFVKMKSCIPTVTRFEITRPMSDTQVWVYDEETNMMIKEENGNE